MHGLLGTASICKSLLHFRLRRRMAWRGLSRARHLACIWSNLLLPWRAFWLQTWASSREAIMCRTIGCSTTSIPSEQKLPISCSSISCLLFPYKYRVTSKWGSSVSYYHSLCGTSARSAQQEARPKPMVELFLLIFYPPAAGDKFLWQWRY